MSQEQRLYPGVGGRRCGAFMSPLFRDPHPTSSRCRGWKCTADVTCDICKDWSVAQWEAFLQKRSCSGHRKSRPSGSDLPAAPQTLPPSALASLEARRFRLSLVHPPPPCLRGRGHSGETEGPPPLSLMGSPLPPSTVLWERGGEGVWLLGAWVTWLLLPLQGLQ